MKIATGADRIQSSGEDSIPPDPGMLIRALRQIGYSFEQAIADLIDNSITANATCILIRFITEGDVIRSLVTADDGDGMSRSRLKEAMKFGSESDATRVTLGKYGMGLKLASLSHARTVSVLSSVKGQSAGRRWTVAGIERGWECEQLSENDVHRWMATPWSELDISRHGTLVVWDDIDKLPTAKQGLKETLKLLAKRLQVHLGLCFHRFLEGDGGGRKVKILLDRQVAGADELMHFHEVKPLNPFLMPKTGAIGYPKHFNVELASGQLFSAEAYIWPPNSDQDEYKLGNRAAARQGFYFYRNSRLIQAGGWNNLVQNESEPHSSLARVRIDLPATLDGDFGLNVQKSAVIVPPTFLPAIAQAKSDDGDGFDAFRQTAQRVYRRKDKRASKDDPIVIGDGVQKSLQDLARQAIAPEDSRVRPVSFAWKELENPSWLFDVDLEVRQILLNKAYRKHLLSGRTQGATDAPLLKVLVFFLLSGEFERERNMSTRRKWLENMNKVLAAAIRVEKVRYG